MTKLLPKLRILDRRGNGTALVVLQDGVECTRRFGAQCPASWRSVPILLREQVKCHSLRPFPDSQGVVVCHLQRGVREWMCSVAGGLEKEAAWLLHNKCLAMNSRA